jgi:hypothetical protein
MAAVMPPRPRTTPLPYLPSWPMPQHVLQAGWPPLWWVGCHGGAGVTTLARMTGIGAEMGAAWPQVPPEWRIQPVVLVARASAAGLRAAEGAVEQWRTRRVLNVRTMGLVVVSASPKRPPKIVTERLQLLEGWMPSIWRVGWLETFLAADDPMDVGVPPDVQAVRHALDGILNEVGAQ